LGKKLAAWAKGASPKKKYPYGKIKLTHLNSLGLESGSWMTSNHQCPKMLQGHGSIISKCLQGCHEEIPRNRGVKTFDIGPPIASSEGYSLPLVNSFPFGAHSSLYLPAQAGIHFSSTATFSSTQKEYLSMARAELPLTVGDIAHCQGIIKVP